MKKLGILPLSILAAFPLPFLSTVPSHSAAIDQLSKADDFSIAVFNQNNEFSLFRALEDKPVYIYMFVTWCQTYVQDSFPEMSENCKNSREAINGLYEEYRDKIHIIGVSSRYSTNETGLPRYKDRYNVKFPIAMDMKNQVFRQFRVKDFPTHILIGKDGTVHHKVKGYPKNLKALLDQLIADQ